MVGSWSRISRAPCKHRWLRKASTPQVLLERGEQIGEGDGGLGAGPRAHHPAQGAALLEVGRRPQQDQAVEHPGERHGARDGSVRLRLRLAKADVMFAV